MVGGRLIAVIHWRDQITSSDPKLPVDPSDVQRQVSARMGRVDGYRTPGRAHPQRQAQQIRFEPHSRKPPSTSYAASGAAGNILQTARNFSSTIKVIDVGP